MLPYWLFPCLFKWTPQTYSQGGQHSYLEQWMHLQNSQYFQFGAHMGILIRHHAIFMNNLGEVLLLLLWTVKTGPWILPTWADITLHPQHFNLDLIRRLERHPEWRLLYRLPFISKAIWFHLGIGKFTGHFTIPMPHLGYFTTQYAVKELTPSQSKALVWNRVSTIWIKKYSKEYYPPSIPPLVDPSLVELNL